MKLSLPATPGFLHLLRVTVAAVAARERFSVDGIDDLALAVHEAAAYLLTCGPATRLVLRVHPAGGGVEASVSVDFGPIDVPDRPEGRAREELALQVLSALADEFRVESGPGMSTIRIAKSAV